MLVGPRQGRRRPRRGHGRLAVQERHGAPTPCRRRRPGDRPADTRLGRRRRHADRAGVTADHRRPDRVHPFGDPPLQERAPPASPHQRCAFSVLETSRGTRPVRHPRRWSLTAHAPIASERPGRRPSDSTTHSTRSAGRCSRRRTAASSPLRTGLRRWWHCPRPRRRHADRPGGRPPRPRNLLEGLIVLNDLFLRGVAVKVMEGIAAGEHTERSLIPDLALAPS